MMGLATGPRTVLQMRRFTVLLSLVALLAFQGAAAATEPSDRCVIVDAEEPVRGVGCAGETACGSAPDLPGCTADPDCRPSQMVEEPDAGEIKACVLEHVCRLDALLRPHCERVMDCATLDPWDPAGAKECFLEAACRLDPSLEPRCDRLPPCAAADPMDPRSLLKECVPPAVCLTVSPLPTLCVQRPF